MTPLQQKHQTSYRDLLCAALVAAVGFYVTYTFAIRGIDPHHDGFMLKTATDVSNGLALYRDTYTQYTPLGIYLQALGVSLLGPSVRSIHIVTCAAYAISACLIYFITKRFTNRVVGVLAALLAIGLGYFYFWNFHPWSNAFAVVFLLAACLCMLRFTGQKKVSGIFLAGVFTACTFWCKQTAGLSILAGLAILLLLWLFRFLNKKEAGKSLLWFFLGNGIVFAVFLLVIIVQGALSAWWVQAIENAADFAASRSGGFGNLFASVWASLWGVRYNAQYDWFWSLLPILSLCLFAASLFVIIRKPRRGKECRPHQEKIFAYLVLSIFCIASWFQYYPVPCYRHAEWGAYPMFCVLAVVAWEVVSFLARKWKHPRVWRTLLTCALLLAVCGTNLIVRINLGYDRLTGSAATPQMAEREASDERTTLEYYDEKYPFLNGLYLSPGETLFYDSFHQAISGAEDAFPDKNIVNLTDLILLSMYTKENAVPKSFGKTGSYGDFEPALREYIKRESPILIMDTGDSPEACENYRLYAAIPGFSGDLFWFADTIVLLVPEE